MRVRFWGVRGSIPVSGEEYLAGGNTSCVEVEHDGQRLVLDAGTGLRALGAELGHGPVELTVLLSHYHWDHIQGVPFFTPAYHPDSNITFAGPRSNGHGVRDLLDRQMQPPSFPIGLSTLAGGKQFADLKTQEDTEIGPFTVRCIDQPHPNGAVAYRVEAAGRTVVYATDTEHGLDGRIDPHLVELSRGVDLLIHDAQYNREEYNGDSGPARKGWGHSTWQEACEAAQLAEVGKLALFHHDPARSDAHLDEIERAARELFPETIAAREGLTLEF